MLTTLLFPIPSPSCSTSTRPTFCLADSSLGCLWLFVSWSLTRWPASNNSSKPASGNSNGSVYAMHKNQQGSTLGNKSAHSELSCTNGNREGQTHKYQWFRCTVPVMLPRPQSRVISVSDISPEKSVELLWTNASGQGTARSAQATVPWGVPSSGVEQAAEEP